MEYTQLPRVFKTIANSVPLLNYPFKRNPNPNPNSRSNCRRSKCRITQIYASTGHMVVCDMGRAITHSALDHIKMCSDAIILDYAFKKFWIMYQKRENNFSAKNEPSFVTVIMLWRLIGIILGEIICESSNWQHIQRLKITILGANWQLFRLERIAKCSYFILSTQNIKFYWFVTKRKKFVLPIW